MSRLILCVLVVVGACNKDEAKPAPAVTPPIVATAPPAAPPAAPDPCVRLAEAAKGERWSTAIAALAELGDRCAPQMDGVVETVAIAMETGKFTNDGHYEATKKLLDQLPLTPAQSARLVAASKQLEAAAKPEHVEAAHAVASRCIHGRDRGEKPLPPPKP
jgi:hypothetical protein